MERDSETTEIPSLAKASQHALPIPRLPPVTMTQPGLFFFSDGGFGILLRCLKLALSESVAIGRVN